MTAYQRMVLRLLFHLVWHFATTDPRSSRAMWNAGKDAQKMLAEDTEHEGEAI